MARGYTIGRLSKKVHFKCGNSYDTFFKFYFWDFIEALIL
ncbi:hypothetical protein LEP1GSC040_1036 [Leptospira santarosai str. 2000030832]|nr:hypothetical protein LEP1GSC040_1036 [Leptospira santarosai str. 2000030832]